MRVCAVCYCSHSEGALVPYITLAAMLLGFFITIGKPPYHLFLANLGINSKLW